MTAEEALAYVRKGDGELSADALHSHLDQCARCRLVLAEAARSVTGGEGDGAAAFRTLADGDRFLDRYQIRRFIARGGMGEVYEAFDSVLSETVALKTLLPTALDDERGVQRVLAEVRVARKVTHPNVCRILEFGLYRSASNARAEVPFLTMELLAGEPLSRRLARVGPLPPVTVRKLASDLAQGLGAIHAAGVVHRDFKSENVFLVPDASGGERAVVTDFGLARHLTDDQPRRSSTSAAGTPDYMAPEQVEGKSPTPAFDVYALGVVIYEMLTGRKPFAGSSPYLVAVKRLQEAAPRASLLVPGLEPSWDALVGRCLERRPELRFPRVELVAAALDATSAVVVTPAPAGKRRPSHWVAALGGVAVAGVVLAVVVSRAPREAPSGRVPVVAASRPIAVDGAPAPAATAAAVVAPGSAPALAASAPAVAALPARSSRAHAVGRRTVVETVAPPSEPVSPSPSLPSPPVAAPARSTDDMLVAAEALMLEGDVDAACKLGEEAAAAHPSLPAAHRFLGRCYVRQGNPVLSRQHYRRYVELLPNAPDAAFVRGILQANK